MNRQSCGRDQCDIESCCQMEEKTAVRELVNKEGSVKECSCVTYCRGQGFRAIREGAQGFVGSLLQHHIILGWAEHLNLQWSRTSNELFIL